MRYVVVIPRYLSNTDYYAIPIGIGYIIAVLKKSGRSVHVINLNERPVVDYSHLPPSKRNRQILAECNSSDIVLTGGLSVHFNAVRNVINAGKAIGCKTILGGGVLAAEPEYVYGLINPMYGVIGEGEETILELAECIESNGDISKVKGVIHSGGMNEPRPSIKDVDSIPFPDYDAIGEPELLARMNPVDEPYFHHNDHPRMVPMITSRSCPFNCSFCFHPIGNHYRQRSLDSVFAEIDHWMEKYKPNIFMFLDELFNRDKDRLVEFCARIKPYGVSWIAQMRVDNVDEQSLLAMKESGCTVVSYGVESMDNDVLKRMHKHITAEQTQKALELTYKLDMGIQGNLVFGTPGETEKTYLKSMAWWEENQKYLINLVAAQSYPGTEMYKMGIENGVIPDKMLFMANEHQVINVTEMGQSQYDGMMKTINETQHKVNYNVYAKAEAKITGESTRGQTLTVKYECPHCHEQITVNNILKGVNPMGRLNFRFACRKCNKRADMELQ